MQIRREFSTAKWLSILAALLALTVGGEPAAAASGPDKAKAKAAATRLQPLRVRTFARLKRLLAGKAPVSTGSTNLLARDTGGLQAQGNSPGGPPEAANGDRQYSATNVQVEGVDEGDFIKTDGTFLYSIQSGALRILRVYPAASMSPIATLKFEDGFSPIELYLDGDRLVVIGNRWFPESGPTTSGLPDSRSATLTAPQVSDEQRTIARVYNVADRANPVQEREVGFTGSYVASRKIGDAVYLVGRTYPLYYGMWAALVDSTAEPPTPIATTPATTLPKVMDTAVAKGKARNLSLARLAYFPDFTDPNYLLVAGFRLTEPKRPADVKSYLGAGEVAYASTKRLYVSAADYRTDLSAASTRLYSFAIGDGKIEFRYAGEVPGTVLNQFSMDEHDGHFRIATTDRRWWQSGENTQTSVKNNVFVLDGKMNVIGRLEGLAEGEQIFSARFMGDRAYLVTFRQTDPLFVIDLASPSAPHVLGELKIPGFSNYLHPYDADHLLGIGHETVAEGEQVRTTGLKLALFDVSDVTAPQLKHSLVIGAAGSYSDATYDHKAVLFDRERNLLALPLTETASQTGADWPSTVFQGAHVYQVSLNDGFTRKAAITHLPTDRPYAWNRYIRRVFTIEDQFYTVSDGRVQANDLSGFAQTGGLDVEPVSTYEMINGTIFSTAFGPDPNP